MDKKFKLKYIYFSPIAHKLYDIYNNIGKGFLNESISLSKNETFNPFFVVGSGRSGNTLLRRILTAKPGIVIPPETYVFGKIFRLHNIYRKLNWEDYVNLILSTFEYHPQFYTFDLDSLSELALDLKKMKPRDRSLAKVINQFYLFYSRKKI